MGYILRQISQIFLYLATLVLYRKREGHSVIRQILPSDHLQFYTPEGWCDVPVLFLKEPERLIKLFFEDGSSTECSASHMFYDIEDQPVYADEVKKGDYLPTKWGARQVVGIHKGYMSITMDCKVNNASESYYTDDVVSHNSVVTGIFLLWYAMFNDMKTVTCLSQNDTKVIELVGKVTDIVMYLPYFLKPGIIKKDLHNLHFDNDSKITATTTTTTSAAGISANLLYMDEFALIHSSYINSFYRTAYPTIAADPTAKLIITSTPRGKNKFYDIWDGALKGKNWYNPLRVDWWEVPGRDEAWRQREIENMGSEEDFNQEYGNQFDSGSEKIFDARTSRICAAREREFIYHEFDVFEDNGVWTEALLWHPKFDVDTLGDPDCKFFITADLAEGDGGDNTAFSVYQLLPMSKPEIEGMLRFTEETDFFKLVQVGRWNDNTKPTEHIALVLYHLIVDVMCHDENVRMSIEVNFDGKLLVKELIRAYGPDNEFEDDAVLVRYLHKIDSVNKKVGIKMLEHNKRDLCKKLKKKARFSQLVITDKDTIKQSSNFMKQKNGTYKAESGYDDLMMNQVVAASLFETDEFYEFVEEVLDNCPKSFINLIEEKLNRSIDIDEDGELGGFDISDLY